MIKGGYQLLNLFGAPGIVKGAYNVLENNHDKRIVVSGLSLGGIQLDEMTVLFTKAQSIYTGMFISDKKYFLIRIQDNDNVSVQEVKLYELPEYDIDDALKVLTIDEEGNLTWRMALPVHTSEDVGKVLIIGENGPEWGTLEVLPEYGEENAGMVLKIDYQWDPISETGSYVPVWQPATNIILVMVSDNAIVNEFHAGDEVVATTVLNNGVLLLPLPTGMATEITILQGGDIATLGEDGKTITISESASAGDIIEVQSVTTYLGLTMTSMMQMLISE